MPRRPSLRAPRTGLTSARNARVLALSGLLCLAVPACGGDAPGEPGTDALGDPGAVIQGGGMPHLSPGEDGVILSWWTESGSAWTLSAARWTAEDGLGPVRSVTRGEDFFVNWADFPSVVEVARDHWVAHWLQRNGEGTYAYGVRTAESRDGGLTWSDPWTPHEDGSPTEHGFAAILPTGDGGWQILWLDGRRYAPGPHGDPTDEMTVRARRVGSDGLPEMERLLDARSCDCCQTDLAATAQGPVAVYRDRSPGEIRDIALVRREAAGWTEPALVHADGWEIAGCPVNGPAVDADAAGTEVVVAWFTEAGGTPRVRVAFSTDAGETFAPPLQVDDGRPLGRVDVVRTGPGAAVVSWLEQRAGGGASVQLRRVTAAGETGPARTVGRTEAARASGFPQLVPVPGGGFLTAWTEPVADGSSRVNYRFIQDGEIPPAPGSELARAGRAAFPTGVTGTDAEREEGAVERGVSPGVVP